MPFLFFWQMGSVLCFYWSFFKAISFLVQPASREAPLSCSYFIFAFAHQRQQPLYSGEVPQKGQKKGTKWPFALFALSGMFCSLLSNVTHSNGNLSPSLPLRQTPGEIGRRHKYESSHEYSCVKLGPLSFNLPLLCAQCSHCRFLTVGLTALSSASSTVCHISLQPSFNDCAEGSKNSLLMLLTIRKTWNMQLLLMMQCWCL